MKKLFISMFALAAVITSCSKSEVMSSRYENIPISFTTYNGRTPEVKAESVQDNKTLGEFQVVAYSTEGEYMNSKLVWDDTNKWGYAVTTEQHYWPGENPLDFYAFAPLNYTTEKPTMVQLNNDKTLTITVPEYAEDQKDVVVAKADGMKYSATNTTNDDATVPGVVTLNFGHMLSRVHFAITTETAADITIDDLKLLGTFNTTGTIDLTKPTLAVSVSSEYETITQDGYTYGYIAEGKSETVFNLESTGELTKSIYTDKLENRYMMIIPQTMKDGAIAVKYTFNGVTTDLTGTDDVISFGTNDAPFTFEAGKSYLFTLKIATNAISFDVAITDWDTDTNTNGSTNEFPLY